jgi:hypothetical protein
MTRTLRNESVAVELGRGWWAAHWADGVVRAGPFTVEVTAPAGSTSRADAGGGGWHVEIGAADGRPGSWARWRPAGDTPAFSLHVPTDGPLLLVEVVVTAGSAAVSALVPGESAGESTESTGESAKATGETGESTGESAPGVGVGVAVAVGRRGDTVRVAVAAGPDAPGLVSAATS